MDEQLKQFIHQNREEFDSEEPSRLLFTRIDQQIHSNSKKKAQWFSLRWAAVITGFLILSAGMYMVIGKNNKGNKTGTEKEQAKSNDEKNNLDINFIGDASYAKQINQFQEIIGLRQEELKQLKNDYPDLYKQFVTDVNELDSSYQYLKIKLAENPNREMLLEAMIQNLQLQSELLNRQLMIIKEIKQKTRSHEKTAI